MAHFPELKKSGAQISNIRESDLSLRPFVRTFYEHPAKLMIFDFSLEKCLSEETGHDVIGATQATPR